MTAYDLYYFLNNAIESYIDYILLKEDPTDEERKNYERIKYWRPSEPDDEPPLSELDDEPPMLPSTSFCTMSESPLV